MRVLYQPTEATPKGWQTVDSSKWGDVVRTGMPALHGLCVQGVTFGGADHYAVREIGPSGVEVAMWHDDPKDWPRGQRWAMVWRFKHLAVSKRAGLGGAITPDHDVTVYAEKTIRDDVFAPAYGAGLVSVQPWSRFDSALYSAALDGLLVTDAQHEAHRAAQTVEGWRTWTEGLDTSELDANGHVKDQRNLGRFVVPHGTRTYYHNNVASTITTHTANNDLSLGLSPAGASSIGSGNIGLAGESAFLSMTPANEPNSAAWPTTGVYRHQIDCTAADATVIFGLLNIGSGSGHFGRINAAATVELQSFQQAQGSFSGSGLHLATVTNPGWSAGAADERFEILIAAQKTSGHGNDTFTLELGETDDFADGPWAAAAVRRIFIT